LRRSGSRAGHNETGSQCEYEPQYYFFHFSSFVYLVTGYNSVVFSEKQTRAYGNQQNADEQDEYDGYCHRTAYQQFGNLPSAAEHLALFN
jgi:hypothetical protein